MNGENGLDVNLTSLAWLQGLFALPTVHQAACVCAECEAETRRARLLTEAAAGRYEPEDDE